jgi:peptidoglycan hydrolase-like protein with peptidoglycan-binding domain
MARTYPYIISNNKIEPILTKLRGAARPEKFTYDLLKKMGFTASNDRAILRILKELGFLNENGNPTEKYDLLKDGTSWKYVLAQQIRELYSELYGIDTNIHNAPDEEIEGAISRVTGSSSELVKRSVSTFKTLAGLANFEPRPNEKSKQQPLPKETKEKPESPEMQSVIRGRVTSDTTFHYNIQIHLPATNDISVYNAIFKSLRDTLFV